MSTNLTQNDQSVLDQIFNPDGELLARPVTQATPETDLEPKIKIDSDLLTKVKQLEIQAIKEAEDGSEEGVFKAIKKLSEIIELCPEYASAYNNRAQAYRMNNQVDKCLVDLDSAIEKGRLTLDKSALKQAYTQRGLLVKTMTTDEYKLEKAQADLELGARFGNEIAKKVAVQDNPYAKLCAAMVQQMMSSTQQ